MIIIFFFSSPECYWVGKSSFRSWRRLMADKLEEVKKKEEDSMKEGTFEVWNVQFSFSLSLKSI